MDFEIQLSASAEKDIDEAVWFIFQDSPVEANRWFDGLMEKIQRNLSSAPTKFTLIPEAESLGIPLRSFPYHSHRVIYRVDLESHLVIVVRVYHGARRNLERLELESPS